MTSPFGGSRPQVRGAVHPSLLIALALVLGVLLWLNLADTDGANTVPVRTSLQETIYVTALALNAEMEATGSFPPDLETLGLDDETLVYAPDSDGYTLVAEAEGVQVEYHHGEDLGPYREAFESLLPPFPEGS